MASQGPDAGIRRSTPAVTMGGSDERSDEPFVFPGLFLVGERAKLDGEFGLPLASMASGTGGMGVFWGGSCPRPTGSERNPFVPPDELDAAYDDAEALLAVSKDLHSGDELLAALGKVVGEEFDGDDPLGAPVGYMPVAAQHQGSRVRTTGTGAVLGDVPSKVPGFELRPETLCRRIVVEAGVAVGAELESRASGKRYQIDADHVVVCADSLRTPQLLWASGIRPPALGHHLNDHLQIHAVALLDGAYVLPEPEPEPAAGVEITALDRVRPPTMGSVLVPYVDEVRPMQGQLIPLSKIGVGLSYFEGLDEATLRSLALLAWYGAKDVRFEDRIEFSDDEVDHYGMPAMTIHYDLTAKDRATVELMRANLARAAGLVGTLVTEPELAPGGSSLHYQGTVRMGVVDDGTSVCDPHHRVWGVENLYVGGNGVIPTSTAANPTLTTVALASRAAARLARSL
jgi:choline dehydrogenase-like flavoprotein